MITNSDLVVIIPFFNFCNDSKIIENLRIQISDLKRQKINFVVVECGYNNNFSLDYNEAYRLNTHSILWQKESIINAAASLLKNNYKYIAWVDSGLLLEDGWHEKAIAKLQDYYALQLFSYGIYESIDGEIEKSPRGMMTCVESENFEYNRSKGEYPSPGGAWCIHSSFFNNSYLYPYEIVGGGDNVFIHAATKCNVFSDGYKNFVGGYMNFMAHFDQRTCLLWYKAASKIIESSSYIDGYYKHLWHTNDVKRKQCSRHQILINNDYNPLKDIIIKNGVLEWSRHNPTFCKQVKEYILGRFDI